MSHHGMKLPSARARQFWIKVARMLLLSTWMGKQEAAPPCGAVKPRVDVERVWFAGRPLCSREQKMTFPP